MPLPPMIDWKDEVDSILHITSMYEEIPNETHAQLMRYLQTRFEGVHLRNATLFAQAVCDRMIEKRKSHDPYLFYTVLGLMLEWCQLSSPPKLPIESKKG
jgi:hypothetical protein